MFSSLLIANRGEIACRVAATARRLGIRTVAVYSDADAGSAHLAACDEAIPIGAAAAVDSYLNVDRILAAARASGAQAIHPGYGFLSENADFASACAAAGHVFVGPPPAAMRAMGDKRQAKSLMRQARVTLIPGYEGADADVKELLAQADRIGYPMLIKAAQGGGGRGIRRVDARDQFEAALDACRREAMAAFADDRVLLERFLPQARHVEVQVFADQHGQCIWLYERDCSAQRRHQKVIEEAPAPGLGEALRQRMGQAAVAAARAVGYVGAGTVEFLLAPGGEFYFMEMNTRLQVEHPVTEMITGLDLVEWQLRVAAGEPLPLAQAQIRAHGHAIEARIYAEDPEHDFMPAIGRIVHLALPAHVAFEGQARGAHGPDPAAVRIDAALRAGDPITPHYDAMVAKLIVWAPDRAGALQRLRQALQQVQLVGPANNVDFLQRIAASDEFGAGCIDTGWIGRAMDGLLAPDARVQPLLVAAASAWILAEEGHAATANPWSQPMGWRLNGVATRPLSLRTSPRGGGELNVVVEYPHHGSAAITLTLPSWRAPLQIESAGPMRLRLRVSGQAVDADVIRDGASLHVFVDGRHGRFVPVDAIARAGEVEASEDRLCAPMPGKVIAVHVTRGERVRRGQALLVIEAMKMQHTIVAPHDGIVEEVRYRIGDQVDEGEILASLSDPGEAGPPP